MNIFENVIITDISEPLTVFSEKGRKYKTDKRPNFGISLCIKGQITYTMNGKEYVSKENNAILLPKNGKYSLIGDKEGIFPLINFDCENLNCDTFKIFPLSNPKEYIKDCEKLSEYFLFKDKRLKIYSHFYDILNRLGNEETENRGILHPTVKYIKENISDPKLSNGLLAKHLGISEVYFRRLFQSQYDTTPKQYILDIRIKKAKQMLGDGIYKITSISEECGFSSLYHFCRIFKEKTGYTPSEYSAKNRNFKI